MSTDLTELIFPSTSVIEPTSSLQRMITMMSIVLFGHPNYQTLAKKNNTVQAYEKFWAPIYIILN
jgi:hypothetical protein